MLKQKIICLPPKTCSGSKKNKIAKKHVFLSKNNIFTSKKVFRSKQNKKWLTGAPKMMISKQQIKKKLKAPFP